MLISRLYLDSFGKLKDYRLDLEPGFNLVYGPNEEGKSTLMGFILMMLYGNSYTGRDMTRNLRLRFRPWDDSPMKGSLFLEIDRVSYRLTRTFHKSNSADEVQLFKEISNETLPIGKSPGESLLGLTCQEFEKSVFISQGGSVVGQSDNEGINERLANMASSGQEDISADKVKERLEKASVQLISKRGDKGLLVEARRELKALQEALLRAEAEEEDIRGYQNRLRQMRALQAKNKKAREEVKEALASCQDRVRWQEAREALESEKNRLALNRDLKENEALLQGPGGPVDDAWIFRIQGLVQKIRDLMRDLASLEKSLGDLDLEVRKLKGEDRKILSQGELTALGELDSRHKSLETQLNEGREDIRIFKLYKEAENKGREILDRQSQLEMERAGLQEGIQETRARILDQEARLTRLLGEESALSLSIRKLREDKEKQEDRLRHLSDLEEELEPPGRAPFLDKKTSAVSSVFLVLLSLVLYFLVGLPALLGLLPAAGLFLYMLIQKNRPCQGLSGPIQNHYLGLIQKERDQLAAIEEKLVVKKESLAAGSREKEAVQSALDLLEDQSRGPKDKLQALDRDLDQIHLASKIQEERVRDLAGTLEGRGLEADQLKLAGLEDAFRDLEEEAGKLERELAGKIASYGAKSLGDLVGRYHEDKRYLEDKADKEAKLERGRALVKEMEGDLQDLYQALNEDLGDLGPVSCLEEAEGRLESLKKQVEEVNRLKLQIQLADRHRPKLALDLGLEELETLFHDLDRALSSKREAWTDPEDFRARVSHLEEEEDALRHELGQLERDLAALESEFRERFRKRTNVSQLEEAILQSRDREDRMALDYEALKMAQSTIGEAFSELQEDFGPMLNQLTAQNLSLLTGHKYKKVKVSRDLDLSVSPDEDSPAYSWQHLSGGTIDQAYLALRLAIIELVIQKDRTLPLFLDDVFAQYDEDRAKLGLAFLKEKTRKQDPGQTVLFTCHRHLVDQAKALGGIHILSL